MKRTTALLCNSLGQKSGILLISRVLIYFLTILYSINSTGQYKGGNNDGFNLTAITNQNLLVNIYSGGNNDGFNLSAITNQNPLVNIYTGGNNDGFNLYAITNQNPLANIYTGGNNDGFNLNAITNQNPLVNIYNGGNNDGFSLNNAVGQNILTAIYFGGSNDGYAALSVASQNPLIIVPVRLLEFTGKWQQEDVLLKWKTASEINNDHFEIERSSDGGRTFQATGMVPGNGTTNTVSEYSFLDTDVKNISGNVFYYRLKQVNIDGLFTYTAIIKLQRNEKELIYTLYPNPGSGLFTIRIQGIRDLSGYGYRLFSQPGSLIQSGKIDNMHTLFDISRMAAGIYWLQVAKDGKQITAIQLILTK